MLYGAKDLIRFRERSEQELSTGEADLQPAGRSTIYRRSALYSSLITHSSYLNKRLLWIATKKSVSDFSATLFS
jgi:hypothetical protein